MHQDATTRPVVLVHGGLAEAMDADTFWVRPGMVAALARRGHDVRAPDRNTTPTSWRRAAEDAAKDLPRRSTVVAGSNGCSVALRLALDRPDLVDRLVLLWPATAGDPAVDRTVPIDAAHLLDGGTVRGVTDAELATLDLPAVVVPTDPEDRWHRHRTARALAELLSGATLLEPAPVPFRASFPAVVDELVDRLLPHL